MRKPTRQNKPDRPAERSPEERARNLLTRLETDGPNPVQAAEELDRLQPALQRAEKLDRVHEEVANLCDAWTAHSLRGDRARAWLVLVGGFGLAEHLPEVGELVRDPGLPASLRVAAIRALTGLRGEEAVHALLPVVLSRGDAQVRAAAAEALAEMGDRSIREELVPLLDEDLPKNVYQAVSTAVDRLR